MHRHFQPTIVGRHERNRVDTSAAGDSADDNLGLDDERSWGLRIIIGSIIT